MKNPASAGFFAVKGLKRFTNMKSGYIIIIY